MMDSDGPRKTKSGRGKEGEEEISPFTYTKVFAVGRYKFQDPRKDTSREDAALVSSFVDELLATSVAGREFAKHSLSIRNAIRGHGEDISTEN